MKYRITLLLSVLLLSSGLLAAPYQNVLDTALAANTTIYLSKTGQATVAVNPAQYNPLADSVFISKVNFGCADINQNTSVIVQIFDTTTSPPIIRLNKSTIINPLDTSAPDVSLVSAHTLYLNQAGTALLTFASIDLGSYDGCGLNINGFKILTKTNYNCLDIGTTPITVSVPDFHGNLTTAVVQITVLDTLPPVINLKPHTLYLSGLGSTATLQFAQINNGTVDNCGLSTITINGASQLTFACADTGFVKVLAQVTDIYGNLAKDSINVYVVDTLNPTYAKTPFTAYLDGDSVFVNRANILSNISGGCYPALLSITSDTIFTCGDISSNPNFISFSITNGSKTILDSVAITVVDTISPSLTLKTDTLILVNGNVSLTFGNVFSSAADNCGVDSATVNGVSAYNYTCADTGVRNVVVVLYDVNGNFTTENISVFVADTVSPSYTKTPFVASLISGTVAVSRADILSNIIAGCYAPTLSFTSDTVFSCADVSTNPHYLTFQFSTGSVSLVDSVVITVIDPAAPMLSLKQDTLFLVGGNVSLTFADVDAGSVDNCSLDSATLNGAASLSYSCADTGVQKVVVVLFDVNGNSSTDSVTIYVADTTLPTYVKTPFTAYLLSDSVQVSRSDVLNAITGSCFPAALTFTSDTVFNCAQIASNPNYLTFEISSGANVILDSVAITVLDNVKPNLLLKSDTLILQNGVVGLDFSKIDNGSSDNCALDSAALNGFSTVNFTCLDTGLHKIVVQLYDVNGNLSTDSVHVFVSDTAAPNYLKTPYSAYLNGDSVVVSRSNILSNVVGGCFPVVVNITSDSVFYCNDISANPQYITFNVTSGLFSKIDSVAVTVLDSISPSLLLKSDTLFLNGIGSTASLIFANINAGSADNCSLDSAGLNGNSSLIFDCSSSGLQKVVVQLYDVSGNFSIDSINVFIVDTLQPTYTKTPVIAYLVGDSAAVNRGDFITNLTGGCEPASLVILSDTLFNCADIANNPNYIYFSATNGFTTVFDSVSVTVADTTAPTLALKSDTLILVGGSATLDFSLINNGSFDNCSLDSALINGASSFFFSCADTGLQNVIVLLYDASGNSTTGSVSVFIADTISVQYTKTPFTANLVGDSAVVSRADVLSNVAGGCFIPAVNILGDSVFYCSAIGTNPNYILFTVGSGLNQVIDSVVVTVVDTTKPNVLLKSDTVYLSGTSAVLAFSNINDNSADNCGLDSATVNGQHQVIFNCSNIGVQTVQVVLYDQSGNFSSDSVNVFVADTTAPSLALKSDTLILVGGVATLDFSIINNGSFDNCSLDSALINGVSSFSFTCSDTGSLKVAVVLFDVSGNSTTDSVDVFIADTISPQYTKTPYTANLAGATAVVSRANILNAISSGCYPPVVTITSDTVFTCADVFNSPHYVTFSISSGIITKFDSVAVSVIDTIKPTLLLKSDTLIFMNGVATLEFEDLDNSSFDNCSLDSATVNGFSQLNFTCLDSGVHLITVVLFDANGNSSTDSISVYITDSINPSYTKMPYTAYLGNDSVIVSRANILTNVIAGCYTPTVTLLSDTVFTCADVASNPYYINFEMIAGLSTIYDSVAVVVADSTKPSLLLKSDTLILQSGQAIMTFANIDAGSSDNCLLDSATINGMNALSFACANAGANTIVVNLYDVNGNVATDSVVVYVQDSVVPTYTKTPYSANLIADSIIISRSDILSNIFGGCSVPLLSILSDTVLTCANALTNPNYIKFEISNGFNPILDSVLVTVFDITPPQFSIKPPPVLALNANGIRVLTSADLLINYPTDNCSIDSIYIVPPALTCANTQSYTSIIITVFDASGNFTTKSSFALATDGIAPTLTTKQDTVYLDNLGTVTITPANVLDTAYDACGIATLSLNKYVYDCTDLGIVPVSVTATDLAGNVKNKIANLYVADSTKPQFSILSNKFVYLDNTGNAAISFADLVVGAGYDNCGIDDTILSNSVFTCTNVGVNPVSVTLTDVAGNFRTNFALVEVYDTIAPQFITQNISRTIDTLTGSVSISPWDLVLSASDNCAIDSSNCFVSPNIFTCNNAGQNVVYIVLFDVNNNSRTISAIVTIDSASISGNEIVGDVMVCGNEYNVKYVLSSYNSSSQYNWQLNKNKGKIISKSYKGREIYVHWFNANDTSFLRVNELNLSNCGTVRTDTIVSISGFAPDTAKIVYWNPVTKTTLVSTDKVSSYFQWGYDEIISGQVVSNLLTGETSNSYYNPDISSNISNLGYRYWCEASLDSQCWNRSYFENKYPIQVPELSLSLLEMWPNPFTDQLNVISGKKIKAITITDLFGKRVLERKFENQQEIVLSGFESLPAATYIVTIRYEDGSSANHKIVRTK